METSQTVNLYITYVEKEGPFLKIWGQTEKNNSIYVEQFLLGASPQFDLGVGKVSLEYLQTGMLVCAKYKDNKYYRARITNVSFLSEGFVEVSFLDYGNKDVIPCGNIRSLQNFPSSFISIPPLATGFIFAEAHCPGGGDWNDTVFDNISKEIKYREVQCTLLIQATQYFLVKIFIGANDLCGMLINRGLMQPISLQAQQAVLLSMSMQRQQPLQPALPASTGINTYKACTLEPGCQYPVYVSYVNDGPCHFSVQLKQSEEVLVMLMNDINMITLRLLEDVPIPGTICLARCQEDGNICRAVVTNEVDNQFKVFYVDFGNYEVVPLDALYQIPFKYVLPKVMAIRFSLAGVEKSTVTLEMQCAFKQFVDNRLLHMKVLPTPTRTAIPKCELWDPETKTSALDVVNRAAQNAYPEPISLNRGFNQPVKVSYVYSCNRFYVQLVNKENELLKLMLDLQASCQTNDSMDLSNIKVGLPCCALFESDQQWYRSQIVEVLGDNVKVRYIDYGNEEAVPSSQLKIIDGEQLTVLRPQAIECCLNGYQNMSEDPERDEILEELILEGQFTMKIVEMTNKKALVELFDGSNYNVASLLLDKLAAAKSQVSPMLVQAGNKIEHRKSFFPQNGPRDQNFRQDRKPGRDNKNYDRTNDRNEKPWRQESKDNKDFRKYDKYSNENTNERKSWRQNNKGFSPNNERHKRDGSPNRSDRYNKVADTTTVADTDIWDTTNDKSNVNNDDWNTPPTVVQHNSRENDFSRNRGRFDNDKENWNSGGHKGGFKKKSDFRKDGSELSSSGSEKSFHKGPRTSSRNDKPKFQKKFDKPRNAPFNNTSAVDESWNVSTVTPTTDTASVTAVFLPYDVVGTESKVIISWFHNPGHFYCQLVEVQAQFKTMMEEIQQFYKSRKPDSSVVGAPVIGLFPEDNVLYRAQVLEVVGTQYKVYYVDFGNVSVINKVWPIEKKFMNLPTQAIVCSLTGIGPPGGEWPNPDSYSKYFDKDVFTCKFVNKDEEKTYVNLFYDNNDIAKALIQEELAVSIEKIIPDIEIPLLFGQQFRAIVKSINNLSDIIIALECGLALSCKMHNLETATETFEDILKGLLEQTVIVYVDNVIDSRLEVTLYDTEGSKLVIINPDEGSYDSVEALCPLLVLRSTLTGYVSYADESSIYIQPIEYAETIAGLLDEMFEFYDSQKQDLPIIPEEGLLYAVHSQDSNWYRAKVLCFDDEKATVLYVDYGNNENVPFSELRELDDTFLEITMLSIQVNLSVPTDTLIDKEVVANIAYGENGWEGTAEAQVPGESSATESVEERGEAVGMAASQIVEEVTETEPTEKTVTDTDPAKAIPCEEIVANLPTESSVVKGTRVVVSHIDSPNEFYLQLAEAMAAIDELQSNLQEQVIEMPVLENPAAGVLCAAPYSGDQQWYRAEVLDADDDITTVRFVDYGNTDVIDNKSTEIKTLPPNLLSLAVYATRSSLKVKSTDEEWNSNAIERFETLANAEVVTAEFIDQDEKTNYVELYCQGENIKDALVQESLALAMELSTESKPYCFLSHLNSPSEFWIQLENCVDELEWIAEQLSGSENFPELEDLTPGTLCAALFPDDEMWYRARILSNTVAGIELLFIDYGNSCMSNTLRQLPEDLIVTPPLAQKCSLQRPDGIPYWTREAANKFNEISADGQTIFTVRKISTGETSVVQLFLVEEDVSFMLLPTTEDGYVKDIESLESFNLEKNGEILSESYKLEAMPGMAWNDESTMKFKELNNQGSVLFQIEFIAKNVVRLYLYGNDIRTSLGGIKRTLLNVSKTSTEEDFAEYESGGNDYLNDTDLTETSEDTTILHEEGNKTENNDKEMNDMDINNLNLESKKAVASNEYFEESLLDTSDSQFGGIKDNKMDSSKSDKSAKTELAQDDSLLEGGEDVEKQVKIGSPTKGASENNVIDRSESDKSAETDLKPTDSLLECGEDVEKKEKMESPTKSDSETNVIDGKTDKSAEPNLAQDNTLLEGGENVEKEDKIESPTKSVSENKVVDDGNGDVNVTSVLYEDAKVSTQGNTVENVIKDIDEDIDEVSVPPEVSSTKNSSEIVLKDIGKDLDAVPVPSEDSPKKNTSENVIKDIDKDLDEVSVPPEVSLKKNTSENVIKDTDKDLDVIPVPHEVSPKKNTLENAMKDIDKDVDEVPVPPAVSPKNNTVENVMKDIDKDLDEVPVPLEVEKTLSDKSTPAVVELSLEKCSVDISTNVKVTPLPDDKIQTTLDGKDIYPAPKQDESGESLIDKHVDVTSLLHDEIEKALDKKDIETSRTSSSCSGKIKHDERILPASISKPHTPLSSTDDNSENNLSEGVTGPEATSVVKDLPADEFDKQEDFEIKSRPQSAGSGKISHDERIVPAALSRPQSPLPVSDDNESQKAKEAN